MCIRDSLNNVIPQSGFFVYEGGTFNWGCKKNDIMILFHKKNAITIKSENYKHLVKLINPASYNVRSNPPYITYNSIGTSSGPGEEPGSKKKKNLTCVPITDQDGKNIAEEGAKDLPWEGSTNSTPSVDVWTNIAIILAILAGILLIYLLGWVWGKATSWRGGGGGGSSDNLASES